MPQQLAFRNYLEKDGLLSPTVYCTFQDTRGYLWFGTRDGLSRFDGSEFKNYKKADGLSDYIINTLCEDQWGNLWIGTARNGLSCLSNGRFANYPHQNDLAGNSINSIAEDKEGNVWFATSRGLSCFDGKIFRHYPTPDSLHTHAIFAIAVGNKGKLWLGTGRGIGCYEKENFKLYSRYSTENGLLDNNITVLQFDSGGRLWIGTKKGLNCLKEGTLTSYTVKEGLSHNTITAIMEDHMHNIWISTWNGISLFSRERIINFSTQNGLPNDFIYSITQDREGNIWFGTHGGAGCLITLNLKTYMKEHGLPDEMINDVIQDKEGKYWFGTMGGLSCYSPGNFKNYSTNDGLISNAINDLMEDSQGNIWIATPQGLSIYSSGSFNNYTKKEGLNNNILFKLFESRDGTIWIGDKTGLLRCRNGQFSAPPFNLEQTSIFCILEDSRGELWFSSRETLYRYSGNRLTSFSRQGSLPDHDIYTLFEDRKGNIWIGTGGGVSCFDRRKFTHYSSKNSALPDSACYCILEDRQGYLWLGNTKGVARFDGKTFRTYTSQRLGLEDRSWLAGITDRSGNLWFGTSESVTTFYPPPVKLNTTPPPVYITGVKVMEQEVPLLAKHRFPYDQNMFRFNFTGISYSMPSGVKYKYRMKNIDKAWQITTDRSLFYPFLPPGSYTLNVKAVNADGVESVKPAEYHFVIRSPFWKTWWFLLLLTLLGSTLMVLLVLWRLKRDREKADIIAKQKELAARNRQLVMSQRMELMGTLAAGTVHDLKNLLAVIIGYSRVMSQKFHDDTENYHNIEIIKNTAATAVQMAKQILSFARPKDHSLDPVELGMVMSEILDTLKVTQPRNIDILWQPPPEPIPFPIHPARFQQLVMNLCLNAFAAMPEGGRLKISLSRTADNEVFLEVADSGSKGIPKEDLKRIFDPLFSTKEHSKGTGLGLFVVKQIVEDYQGKIEAHSEPGKGTTFIIKFPLTFTFASGGSEPFCKKVPTPPKTFDNEKLLEVQKPFLEKVFGRRSH